MIREALAALIFFAVSGAAQAQPRWQDVRPAPSEERLAAAEMLERPPWIEMPDAHDFAAVFPRSRVGPAAGAVTRGRSVITPSTDAGVQLDCLIEMDGRLACRPTITQENEIFVRPALMVATKFRVAHITPDGASTLGRRIRRTIRFMSP